MHVNVRQQRRHHSALRVPRWKFSLSMRHFFSFILGYDVRMLGRFSIGGAGARRGASWRPQANSRLSGGAAEGLRASRSHVKGGYHPIPCRGRTIGREHHPGVEPDGPVAHSLMYLSSTEPACRGERIVFCGPGPCPGLESVRNVRVCYASPHGGQLLVEPIQP